MTARAFLGSSRAAVGLVSLVAPLTSARIFGLDPDRSDERVARLFGSRELALALLLLRAASRDDVRKVAQIGAMIEAVDVASSAAGVSQGRLAPWTIASGDAGAALFCVLGVMVAREA